MAVEEVLDSFANCETLIFLRSVLRSKENLLQNCAILRNALRKQNEEYSSGSNAMQSSETLRNSLSLNYESPALTAELQAHICCKTNHANGKIQKEQEQSEARPDGARGATKQN